MRVLHISRRHLVLTAVLLTVAVSATVVLGGCFQKHPEETTSSVVTDADRIAFLSSYGWEIEEKALETLDLVLPAELGQKWSDYVNLQDGQGFPFSDYGGQAVRRYTYAVTNYENGSRGVQANLDHCGDKIIGADIIVTGEGGGQYDIVKK